MGEVRARKLHLALKDLANLRPVLMQRRHDDMRRLIVPQLNDQLCQISLIRVNTRCLQRLVELDLLGRHRLDFDDFGRRFAIRPARLHQPNHDPPRIFRILRPVHMAAGSGAIPLELLQVEIQVPHRVLADLFARLAQVLPVRHLGHNLGALGLNHLGRVAHVLAQLRVTHQCSCRHLELGRRPRVQSRVTHRSSPSERSSFWTQSRISVFGFVPRPLITGRLLRWPESPQCAPAARPSAPGAARRRYASGRSYRIPSLPPPACSALRVLFPTASRWKPRHS